MNAPVGLSADEVAERTRRGQTNAAGTTSSRSVLTILRTNLFTFFNNILFVIGAALIALGRWTDAVTSVGLGLVNALIGTVQEIRAKRKLDAIALLSRTTVTVLRDGQRVQVDPSAVVQGDVVVAVPGEQVVADGTVLPERSLGVDESLLTGEADVLTKKPGDTVLSGSVIVRGTGYYEATRVGAASYAAELTATVREFVPSQTPVQRQINTLVRAITLVVALISFAILFQALLESFAISRIVQVSAVLSGQVPYGLFFVVALAYAAGAATLARTGALVQQTNAVESLANVDTVCLDKTGTLTTGRLEVAQVLVLPDTTGLAATQSEVERLLGTYARSTGSPNGTSLALAALPGDTVVPVAEVPFRSATKWSSQSLPGDVLGERSADWRTLVLGAPEVLAPTLGEGRELFDAAGLAGAAQHEWSRQGLRVLLLAVTDEPIRESADGTPQFTPRSLSPLALVALRDELREHALETLQSLGAAGVDLKIISGDNPDTVAALARQAGLGPDLLLFTGAQLDAMDEAAFAEAARTGTIFGRALPAHKERLVSALRDQGRYVAMLGDGTNDALSLKRAHVGIAMESGSPVTRNVADMVLLGDSFAAVGPAVTEGRRIVNGLERSLLLFIPRVITSILVIAFVAILQLGFPYEPAQVALTVFTVGIPSLALTYWARPEPPHPRLLSRVRGFALPAGIITANIGTVLYAGFYTMVSHGVVDRTLPPRALQRWESYTGLDVTSADFAGAAATIVAQTALSTFVSMAAFGLILFVEPPTRFFTGWEPDPSPDKRPAWLAAGLVLVFLVVLNVEALASWFGLLTPGGPERWVLPLALTVWFFALRTAYRRRRFDRFLGLAS